MKTIGVLLSALALSCACVFAHPTTPEAFVEAWKKAVETKDLAAIEKLTYLEGLDEESRNRVLRPDRFDHVGGIKAVTLEPLPDGFMFGIQAARGKKVEMLKSPIGMIKVQHNERSSSSAPYVIVDGKYFVIAPKVSDLNWQGSPDVFWGYSVEGNGANNLEIEYSWNASGVDMTRKIKNYNNSFAAQHINWIKVTTNDPNSEIVLKLSKDDNVFYTSEPLKGKGIIEYKKPN